MAEQLQAAFTAMGDRLRLAVRAIRPAVKLGVAAIIEFAHYLHEQLSIKRLTGRMRSDPSRDLAERARRPPLRARPPTTTPPSPSLPLHEHRHDDPLVRKRVRPVLRRARVLRVSRWATRKQRPTQKGTPSVTLSFAAP